ncbi:hypothetical protein H257_19350 [Aphanomyces astaci]|uniref:Uncharacterized protein n=1 Tax=Aphanomyces astaci TaxID=112090 RepID=W4F9X4_APHAT|nr:hypothetical protein H257_19350 [Aphanomyces astaci]ETV63719.1 hypothetical protein H257_19350 [Aphanomyces astaci]|eukprot:XP_009846798.1 hypothetical protein H257_19350 [Aphanomyces astaci]
MDVVIAWMACEASYVRWEGGDKHSGATKASLATEIVGKLGAHGIVDEDSIQKEVHRICPYYYTLDEVMRDRASTAPLVTSDDLDLGGSDNEAEPSLPPQASEHEKKR